MVIALVILTLIVCLTVEALRRSRSAPMPESQVSEAKVAVAAEVIERYLHPGHTWALVQGPKDITVGVDDIVQRLIGKVESIEIRPQGSLVAQGDALVTLRRGQRSLTLVAPVSGTLVEINKRLEDHASLVNDSPYDKGWIAKVLPARLGVELRNLLKGAMAERWMEGVRAQVGQWFGPKLGMVLQDGGQWIENPGEMLNDKEWSELAATVFPACSSSGINNSLNKE